MKKLHLLNLFVAIVVVAVCAAIGSSTSVAANSISTTTLVTEGKGRGSDEYTNNGKGNALSSDGRFAVFTSKSANLVPNDKNGQTDVFVYDSIKKTTELISKTADGLPASYGGDSPSISADGRYVAYVTGSDGIPTDVPYRCGETCPNMILHDRVTKTNRVINRNNQGRVILVAGAPQVSADGRYVAFSMFDPINSGDKNSYYDIVVRDMQTGINQPASVDSNGKVGWFGAIEFSMSGDGQRIAFTSPSKLTPNDNEAASDDVFLRDQQAGTTTLVSKFYNDKSHTEQTASSQPAISRDGRFVAFTSLSEFMVAGDSNKRSDIFLYDVGASTARRVSVSSQGKEADDDSQSPSISGDGSYVVFDSDARNLVPMDNKMSNDIFMHWCNFGVTRQLSVASHDGAPSDGYSYNAAVSGDGKAVSFISGASNLHPTPIDMAPNLYLFYNPVVFIPYYDPIDFWKGSF